MTSITNAKCSFSGNPSLKPSLIDHAKELPTITGAMALRDKKRTEKVTYGKSVAGFNFGLSELMRFIYKQYCSIHVAAIYYFVQCCSRSTLHLSTLSQHAYGCKSSK